MLDCQRSVRLLLDTAPTTDRHAKDDTEAGSLAATRHSRRSSIMVLGNYGGGLSGGGRFGLFAVAVYVDGVRLMDTFYVDRPLRP